MSRNLRILHCLRAPVGGLFRHVVDLAMEQAKLGHKVGVIYDKLTVSKAIEDQLCSLKQVCQLGVRSTIMPRLISIRDVSAYGEVKKFAREVDAQILHGHGAKGGAYARLVAASLHKEGYGCKCIYTPHGGSLHYSPKQIKGRLFLKLEKKLAPKTNGIIFESAYSANIYNQVIGRGFCPDKIIPNGLRVEEFAPVALDHDAADFLFVGELRLLKGVDLLLEAIALLKQQYNLRLVIVGEGPDEALFQSMRKSLKLTENVQFLGRLPARIAFSKASCLVVPSRAESFPYIVLEAGAAAKPLIATDVGGISEIVEGTNYQLVQSNDVEALAQMLGKYIINKGLFQAHADELQNLLLNKFTVETMAARITDFYLSILRR